MACNCNRGGKKLSYVHTAPDGTSKTYNTEMEARAAKIRGGGTVATVAK